ncbi:MAG: beta-N-acetylglucosaminidase domain-containing protein [Elusimicrobiota bacterium]
MRKLLIAIAVTVATAISSSLQGANIVYPNYIGKIIPAPKEVVYYPDFLMVYKKSAVASSLLIVTSSTVAPAVEYAIELFNGKLQFVSSTTSVVDVISAPLKDYGKYDTIISLGDNGLTEELENKYNLTYSTTALANSEGYVVKTVKHNNKNVIICKSNTSRGLAYSLISLIHMMTTDKDGNVVLQKVEVTDWPSYKVRTVSGTTQFAKMKEYARWMPLYKLNMIDINYNTHDWRNPDQRYTEFVKDVCNNSRDIGLVDIMQFVNPYYSVKVTTSSRIVVSDPAERDRLFADFENSLAQGGKYIMLCADDYTHYKDKEFILFYEGDKQMFKTVADAQAFLVNDVYRRVKAKYPETTIIFCAPHYSNGHVYGWSREPKLAIDYFKELADKIPLDVPIVWTGPTVRSFKITEDDVKVFSGFINGRIPFLWDNTSYAHHKPLICFFDAYEIDLPANFYELTNPSGIHMNGTVSEIYKLTHVTGGDYMWNPGKYNANQSTKDTLASLLGPSCAEPVLDLKNQYFETLNVVLTTPRNKSYQSTVSSSLSILDAKLDSVAKVCNDTAMMSEIRNTIRTPRVEYQKVLDIKKVVVKKLMSGAKLDPAISFTDEKWETLTRTSQFIPMDNSGKIPPTYAYVGYDNNNLYIAVVAEEPYVNKLGGKVTKRDSGVYNEDSIELFIDPKLTRDTYWHLGVNSINTQYDSQVKPGTSKTAEANIEWMSNVEKDYNKSRWIAKFVIPFKSLGMVPVAGDTWGLNLNRQRYIDIADPQELSTWAGLTGRMFFQPKLFGELVFE